MKVGWAKMLALGLWTSMTFRDGLKINVLRNKRGRGRTAAAICFVRDAILSVRLLRPFSFALSRPPSPSFSLLVVGRITNGKILDSFS